MSFSHTTQFVDSPSFLPALSLPNQFCTDHLSFYPSDTHRKFLARHYANKHYTHAESSLQIASWMVTHILWCRSATEVSLL